MQIHFNLQSISLRDYVLLSSCPKSSHKAVNIHTQEISVSVKQQQKPEHKLTTVPQKFQRSQSRGASNENIWVSRINLPFNSLSLTKSLSLSMETQNTSLYAIPSCLHFDPSFEIKQLYYTFICNHQYNKNV